MHTGFETVRMHVSRDRGVANEYSPRSPSSGLSSFAVNQRTPCTIPRSHFRGIRTGAKRNRSPWEFTFCWPAPPFDVQSTESKATEMLRHRTSSTVSRTKKLKAILTDAQMGADTGDKAPINPANRSFTRVKCNWIARRIFLFFLQSDESKVN